MDNTTFPKFTDIIDGSENQTATTASVSPTGGSVCFVIDRQTAFIVVASAGCLILVLLISVLVLACKVINIKRQYQGRRSLRSNMDVSGPGHWSTEQAEEGIVGPCETNLLLEEVRTEAEDEAVPEEDEEEAMLHQSNTRNKDEENVRFTMQSSTSRDSCIDPTKELEDMPLVV